MTDLHETLVALGVSTAEAAEAERAGTLDLLVLERVLVPGPRRYDMRRLADETGVPLATLRRVWRALGFPDPAPHEHAFTDADVAALQAARNQFADGAQIERSLQQLRVTSASLARIAEIRVDDYAARRAALQEGGHTQREVTTALVNSADIEQGTALFLHLYRRQLLAAMRRRLSVENPTAAAGQATCIGFVDMVGFTALTEELELDELGATVTAFETRAYETVAEHGGRVIKTIGDEVMFTAEPPAAAVEVALRLAVDEQRGPLTPEVRAGIAYGAVLAREGDCYGSVVNLANRLVNIAYPGTVLVSESLHAQLVDDARYEWRFLHPRRLKGLGRVPAWAVRHPRLSDSTSGQVAD